MNSGVYDQLALTMILTPLNRPRIIFPTMVLDDSWDIFIKNIAVAFLPHTVRNA